ncbi:YcaO-like family protein [bacterium]|nr:YcaO-like family protein [bacterium]
MTLYIDGDATYIKGKDAPLEDTIKKIHLILKNHGFNIVETSIINAVSNIWSVCISDEECPLLYVNGKGSSYKAALASALAEFIERIATKFIFADFYFGEDISNNDFVFFKNEKWFPSLKQGLKEGMLTKDLYDFYNFEDSLDYNLLVDFNTGAQKRGIASLPFKRLKDDVEIYFPISILSNLYVSNGMSAGNTKYEAYVQALCEIIERFVKNKIIKECLSLPVIPENILLDVFPQIKNIRKELLDKGYEFNVYDASLGGKFPVISAALFDKKNNAVLPSFGSHLNMGIAVERTLTELIQGRDLTDFSDVKSPIFDKEIVASDENLIEHFINSTGYISWDFLSNKSDYDFVLWNNELNNEESFKYICSLIHGLGKDIYIADYDYDGFNVCRIIVPDFSEVYPVSDLIYNNISSGINIREKILNFKNLDKDGFLDLLDIIEQEGFDDYSKLFEIIGIIPDKGSAWEYLSIGDVRLSICLFLNNLQEAYSIVDFLLENCSNDNVNLYNCIKTLLDIKLNREDKHSFYEQSCIKLYGREIYDKSDAIVNQRERLVWEKNEKYILLNKKFFS